MVRQNKSQVVQYNIIIRNELVDRLLFLHWNSSKLRTWLGISVNSFTLKRELCGGFQIESATFLFQVHELFFFLLCRAFRLDLFFSLVHWISFEGNKFDQLASVAPDKERFDFSKLAESATKGKKSEGSTKDAVITKVFYCRYTKVFMNSLLIILLICESDKRWLHKTAKLKKLMTDYFAFNNTEAPFATLSARNHGEETREKLAVKKSISAHSAADHFPRGTIASSTRGHTPMNGKQNLQ